MLAITTALYALSPIDLIPDFIPLLSYLDDVIILPLMILLTIRLIPAEVMADLRLKADVRLERRLPASRIGAAIILAIWGFTAGLAAVWAYRLFNIE